MRTRQSSSKESTTEWTVIGLGACWVGFAEADFDQSHFGHPDLANLPNPIWARTNVGQSYVGFVCVMVGPRGWAPKCGAEGWGPEGWGTHNFAFFFFVSVEQIWIDN